MDIEYIFLLAFNPLFLMFTAFCICLICGVGGAALAGFNTGSSYRSNNDNFICI